LVFLHHDLAVIAITIIYLTVLLNLVKDYNLRVFHILSYAMIILAMIGVFSFEYLPIPDKYLASYFDIDMLAKSNILVSSYSPVILLFSAIGTIYCLIKRIELTLCVPLIMVLALYFINISLTIRVMIFLTVFMSYFSARVFKSLL
jgi:hypothetical protein